MGQSVQQLDLSRDWEKFKDIGCLFPKNACFMNHSASLGDNGLPFYAVDHKATGYKITQDAALSSTTTTSSNVAFPVQWYNYIDPEVIPIIFTPQVATELLPEKKLGDFTTDNITITLSEAVGATTAYADYTDNFVAGSNYYYPTRQTFRYQTGYTYGNLEVERAAAAKVQLVSDRQRNAADIMNYVGNQYYLFGVRGLNIHGILNAPDLDEPIAASDAISSIDQKTTLTTWAEKATDSFAGANYIYNDVLTLWSEIAAKSNGRVNLRSSSVTLAIPPKIEPLLATTNNYNVPVTALIKGSIPGINIVVVPELAMEEGNRAMLICNNAVGYGGPGYCVFTEKVRMSPVIPDVNSYKQTMSAATGGAIITRPMLIAIMTGI